MANSEIVEVIHSQKLLMLMTAMWPEMHPTFLYKLRANLVLGCVIVAISMMIVELVHVFEDYKKLTDTLSIFISPAFYVIKHFIFIYKKESFLKILNLIKKPIFTQYPAYLDPLMRSTIGKSKAVSIMFQSSCAGVIILYSCKPFVTSTYELPFSMSFADFGGWKYLVHFWQSCSLLFAAWNNSCLDLIAISFMMAGAAHFDIVQNRILVVRDVAQLAVRGVEAGEDDVSDEIDSEVNKVLGDCVRHHMAIIKFLNLVEETFTYGFMVQFLNSVFVICNIGFQLAHASPNSMQFLIMVLYFAAMMIQLAIYCWFGNELMLNSVKIRDACYFCNWTSCGTSVRRSLFIIMERTKRPVFLTAGKFADLSLQSFTSILQSSYSYFALIQRLYNEDIENK